MSIYCPVLDHKVTYIHCQDCDGDCRKTSKKDNNDTAANPDDSVFYCIVAGGRDFDDYELMKRKLDSILSKQIKVVIISGHANGADKLGERYAKEKGHELIIVPAEWQLYGKRAGYLRNRRMHMIASQHKKRGCVCFWDGRSKGTAQNFEIAKEYDVQLKVIRYKK